MRARCDSPRLLFASRGSHWRLVHDVGPLAAELEFVCRGLNVFEIPTTLPIAKLFDLAFEFAEKAFVVVHGKFDGFSALQVRA